MVKVRILKLCSRRTWQPASTPAVAQSASNCWSNRCSEKWNGSGFFLSFNSILSFFSAATIESISWAGMVALHHQNANGGAYLAYSMTWGVINSTDALAFAIASQNLHPIIPSALFLAPNWTSIATWRSISKAGRRRYFNSEEEGRQVASNWVTGRYLETTKKAAPKIFSAKVLVDW